MNDLEIYETVMREWPFLAKGSPDRDDSIYQTAVIRNNSTDESRESIAEYLDQFDQPKGI